MSIYEIKDLDITNYLLLENLKLFCEIVLITSRMFQNCCLVVINIILRIFFKLDLKLLQNITNSPGATTGKVQTPTSAGSEVSKNNNLKLANTPNGKIESPSKSETTPHSSKKSSHSKQKPHENFRNAFLLGGFFWVWFILYKEILPDDDKGFPTEELPDIIKVNHIPQRLTTAQSVIDSPTTQALKAFERLAVNSGEFVW